MGEWKATNSQTTMPTPPLSNVVPLKLAPKPIALADQLRGVDLSHHNASVDFQVMRKAGWQFALHKATEALDFVDNKFADRRSMAKDAGVIFGAYHFFRANVDPKKQAEHFLKTIGEVKTGELDPMFDWETEDDTALTKHPDLAMTFLNIIESETGRLPIIYSYVDFLQRLNLPLYFARYPLWIAHLGVKSPTIPKPWTKHLIWQYSWSEVVPGVSSHCDADLFNGTRADLDALASLAVPLTVA